MMFALCLKIPTIFLEMIICWTTDLPTFSVLPFLLISYQSVVTSWRGILTDVKYIEKWQSIPVALVFCINHYDFFLYVARDLLLIFPHTILTHYLLLYIYIHFIGLWISFRTSTAPVEPLSVCFLFVCEIEGMRCWWWARGLSSKWEDLQCT